MKPKITEEWIEDKAKEIASICNKPYSGWVFPKKLMDFIRSLIEEILASKGGIAYPSKADWDSLKEEDWDSGRDAYGGDREDE